MTQSPPADPADPDQLVEAFLVVTDTCAVRDTLLEHPAPKPLDRLSRAQIIDIVANNDYWFAPMITVPEPANDNAECD
jgi:hypothetical protein